MSKQLTFGETPEGRSLAWLADAPMFIDGEQVTALYNAVAKPEYENGTITVSLKNLRSGKVEGEGALETQIGVASWVKVKTIFPFLDANVKGSVKATVGGELGKEEENQVELRPIETPQRQLVQLALHYLTNLAHRTRIVTKPAETDWLEATFVTTLPRGLVFVEFAPKTRFVPMAAELDNGKIATIYSDLVNSFVGPKERPPQYPEPAYYVDQDEKLTADREEYWNFFEKHFSSTLAMEAIESKVSQGGLLRWIDYRVPLGPGMPCLHLHISGRGQYHTGTFAYQLVKPGFKHGLRIVGTMKSEPAMNLMAIFER